MQKVNDNIRFSPILTRAFSIENKWVMQKLAMPALNYYNLSDVTKKSSVIIIIKGTFAY